VARVKRFVFALLVPVLTAQNAWGPDEVRSTNHPYTLPAAVTLRVQSSLVEVGVVVRDAHGNVVEGLERKDFRIFDDGKERDISAFSVETAAKAGLGSRHQKNSPAAAPSIAARSVILFFDDNSISAGPDRRRRYA
jgi:VWFA-related protein